MSAIAAIFYLNGRPVQPGQIEPMLDQLAHRGPDGGGVWTDGAVALGHRMLRTTPEASYEQLPLVAAGGNLVLTADARIDNRKELLSLLGLTDRRPGEVADAELIVQAYERWGEQCPERLIGDFAFAIWDRRKERLFLARDPMGIKPLYLHHQPGRLCAVASEIKALTVLEEVPRRLNEYAVASHLVQAIEDQSLTFYHGVTRLPAAHSAVVDRDGMRLRCYWSLDHSVELRLQSNGEYVEAFRDLFEEAVRCRLRSATPVCAALSGGLDSSSIACTARELLRRQPGAALHTISAIFPSLPAEDLRQIDEREYIAAVVDQGGAAAHYVRADLLSPLRDLEKVLWHEDQPILAPNLYMHWAMYGEAREIGSRVFLDGIDGDSTISHGFGYLTELARRGRWLKLSQEVGLLSGCLQVSRRRLLRDFCARPLVLDPLRRARHALAPRPQPDPFAETDINRDFAVRMEVTEVRRRLAAGRPVLPVNARTEHWHNLTSPLYPYAMEIADKAAAAAHVEARYPFFDRRLMEFCLALPADQKLSDGWTRFILRQAMQGILPPKIQWRVKKGNLGRNFDRKMLEYDRPLMDAAILSDTPGLATFVNLPPLRLAYQQYAADPLRASGETIRVYIATVLAHWLRRSRIEGSAA